MNQLHKKLYRLANQMYTVMSFLFATLLLLFSCEQTSSINDERISTQLETEQAFDIAEHQKNYTQLKKRIEDYKGMLKNSRMTEDLKLKRAQNYISNTLIDSIIPYWIGTKWDFNGISPEPRKGEIACGYFVSTTLRDVGVNLNRYKVAQKAASEIVKELCAPTSIKNLSSLDKLNDYLSEVKDGELLIVGLDFHVGFIFKNEGKSFFAHSNYINREGVIVEELNASQAIQASNAYYVGNVTKNISLTKKWLAIQ